MLSAGRNLPREKGFQVLQVKEHQDPLSQSLIINHSFTSLSVWIIISCDSASKFAAPPCSPPPQSAPCRARWRSGTCLPWEISGWTGIVGTSDWSCIRCFQCGTSQEQSRFHPECRKEMACRAVGQGWRIGPVTNVVHRRVNSVPSWYCWSAHLIMLLWSRLAHQWEWYAL